MEPAVPKANANGHGDKINHKKMLHANVHNVPLLMPQSKGSTVIVRSQLVLNSDRNAE